MPAYGCSGCASAVPADELRDEHGRPVRLPTADMTHTVHTGDPAGTLLCGPVLPGSFPPASPA